MAGTRVNPPCCKMSAFFLGPCLIVCQSIEISNQMEVNGHVSNFEKKIIYRDCCIKNVTNIIFKGITDLINKKHYHDYVWAFNILPVFWICWIFKDLVFIFGPRSVFMKLGWWQMIYIKIHNICFKMFLVPFLID